MASTLAISLDENSDIKIKKIDNFISKANMCISGSTFISFAGLLNSGGNQCTCTDSASFLKFLEFIYNPNKNNFFKTNEEKLDFMLMWNKMACPAENGKISVIPSRGCRYDKENKYLECYESVCNNLFVRIVEALKPEAINVTSYKLKFDIFCRNLEYATFEKNQDIQIKLTLKWCDSNQEVSTIFDLSNPGIAYENIALQWSTNPEFKKII